MTRKATFLVIFVTLVAALHGAVGCDSSVESSAPEPLASEPAEYVYIGMRDTDAPFADYEGDGMVLENVTRRRRAGDPYEVALVAVERDFASQVYVIGDDVSDRVLVRLEGEVTRKGEAGFHMRGSLEARRPARIQFVQMTAEGDSSGESFPELAFQPGKHDFVFDAALVGWLE